MSSALVLFSQSTGDLILVILFLMKGLSKVNYEGYLFRYAQIHYFKTVLHQTPKNNCKKITK